LWSEHIDEMFTQNSAQIQCAKVPKCFLTSFSGG